MVYQYYLQLFLQINAVEKHSNTTIVTKVSYPKVEGFLHANVLLKILCYYKASTLDMVFGHCFALLHVDKNKKIKRDKPRQFQTIICLKLKQELKCSYATWDKHIS